MSIERLKQQLDSDTIKTKLNQQLDALKVDSITKINDDNQIRVLAGNVYKALPAIPIRALIRATIKKEGFENLILKIRDKMLELDTNNLEWLNKQQLIMLLSKQPLTVNKKQEGKMKLYIKRDQAEQKGLFGGSKGFSFSLSCRLELSEKEINIIEKYKQWETPVYSYKTTKGTVESWSLRELTTGRTVNCAGVADLLSDEEEIKKACANIQILLDVMESFGGEEVFEY